uniref:Uncharacterized protein n=1 Tax=Ananas comosus var. bracteatus TaxID=296719 RepID=A0A6V7PRR7_ANACO|nr:unnamed protein product [Ananas comosus var. bracteatus]
MQIYYAIHIHYSINLASPKVHPDSSFNLTGEENLHSHTETIYGTTTSAPVVKYSGDHYLGGATTPSVNRLEAQLLRDDTPHLRLDGSPNRLHQRVKLPSK